MEELDANIANCILAPLLKVNWSILKVTLEYNLDINFEF